MNYKAINYQYIVKFRWGAPAYISFPHFYHADPYYRKAVIGMNPSENRHQMYIDIEPVRVTTLVC